MNEEKIQFKIGDCPKLKEDIEKMQNSYQQEINKLHQEIDQYKNNWEELKEWLKEEQKLKGINNQIFSWGVCGDCLNKMKELEEDK